MSSIRPTAERRFYPRHRVRVAVLWSDRDREAMRGEICDVSTQGLFLVASSALPDDVGVGDNTRITVRTLTGDEVMTGIVRWRGYHPVHDAIGCGVQLDEPSMAVIARLFPVLRDPPPTKKAPDPAA
jgi:PilZ domain